MACGSARLAKSALSGATAIAASSILLSSKQRNVRCAPDLPPKKPPKQCLGPFREESLGIDFDDRLMIGMSPGQHSRGFLGEAFSAGSGGFQGCAMTQIFMNMYVDEGSFNRIKADCKSDSKTLVDCIMNEKVEKTFVFTFTSKKDAAHVKRGFERSLGAFCEEGDDNMKKQIGQFVDLLSGPDIEPGTRIAVTCQPTDPGRVIVKYEDAKDTTKLVFEGTTFHGSGLCKSLIHAFHCLYLGDEKNAGRAKYEDIKSKLAAAATERLLAVGCS